MTSSSKKQVADKQLGQLSRQFIELMRRVSEGTLNPEETSWLLQQLIDGNLAPLCHPNGMEFNKSRTSLFTDHHYGPSLDDHWEVNPDPEVILAEGLKLNPDHLGFRFNFTLWEHRGEGYIVRLMADDEEGNLEYYRFSDRLSDVIDDNIWMTARLALEAEPEELLQRWFCLRAKIGIHLLDSSTVIVLIAGPNGYLSSVRIPRAETVSWLVVDDRNSDTSFHAQSTVEFHKIWVNKALALR